MLGHLVRKEMLDHILSLRFLILSALGALILWLSLYSGYVFYQNSLTDYRLAQVATEDRIREITATENASEFVYIGRLEHKPPTPMSIFVRGLEPTLGRSISDAGSSIQRLIFSPVEVRPLLGVFPRLDLGLVVRIVLSLFVLLLTYDAVCGEKEAGTLRLITSFSVSRGHLLLGKFLGVLIPAFAVFGLPLLLGLAVIILMPDVHFDPPELGRLGLVFVAFGLYLAAFICAGLLASSLTHRAPTAFVMLLGFWVITVVVLPRLSLILAEGIRPAPSFYQLDAEKEAIAKSQGEKWRDARAKWEEEYRRSKGHDFWKTQDGREAYRLYWRKTRWEVSLAPTDLEYDRLDEAFRNRYNARLDLAVTLARFSPAFAFNNAIVRLSGTGLDRQQRFFEAFNLYYKKRRSWYIDWVDRDELRKINPVKYGPYKWDISDMPRFIYQEAWPEKDITTTLVDVGILALWGTLLFAGAYLAMLRYDLR